MHAHIIEIMPRFVTFLLLCLIAVCGFATAQKALAPVKFTTFRHPAPGYFLLGPNSPDSVALIDHSGQNLFQRRSPSPANFLFSDSTVTHFDGVKRVFVRRNSHMEITDTLRLDGPYLVDYHEGHMLLNGNYVVLGTDVRTIDMSTIVPGGNSAARVSGAIFQERTLDGQTVFEWKSLDHIPITDATEEIELIQPTIDYIHVNTIVEDSDGNFLLSCRHLDEVIKVNRTTGNVMWRLGGSKSKGNQFTFLNDNVGFVGFSHQHDVMRTSTGRILMMDNGNLKPVKFSRAVEYEINETLKTVRMTWSFRATPDLYAPGMGSVQELENGNVLVGWGLASQVVLAHEVSRDGKVQAELHADGRAIPSYRVRKVIFAMSGAERVVSTPGTYTFTRRDSNTHITMVLTRVDSATSVITERHSVLPHNLDFVASAPCVPLPMRWVIRVNDTAKVAGATRFALGALPMVIVPAQVRLYHRNTEGIGKFSQVVSSYDATSRVLAVNFVRPGEYALAFPMCYDPVPTSPGADASQVALSPTLAWSEGLQSEGYDVELYIASNPSPLYTFRTSGLDTTVTGLIAGEVYTWRVRARRPNAGPWSALYTFRTRLSAPISNSPNSLPDSVAVEVRPIFTWSSVPHAKAYRLQVFEPGSEGPVVDTVLQAAIFQWSKSFEHHVWHQWRVCAELDTQAGDWSSQLSFITRPKSSELLQPFSEELEVDPDAVETSWKSVIGGVLYVIRLFKDVSPNAIHEDTVAELRATLPVLRDVTRYYWQVRTLSRYGASEWTPKRWFLTSGSSTLAATNLLSPVGSQTVDTLNTTLTWTPVEGATFYQVELTANPTFSNPEFEWFDVLETSKLVPKLQSGRVYHWRVMALSDVASGMWSKSLFTTLPGPNDMLRPLTPIDGSVDVPTQGFATFITDARFTTYRAEFSTEQDFARIAYAIAGSISPLPFMLDQGSHYWWRVVGMQNGLEMDTGSVAAFETILPTSVIAGHLLSEHPEITFRGSHLEVRGRIGGSRIQIFDVLGHLVMTTNVPGGADVWYQSLAGLPATPHIVVVDTPFGNIACATFVISSSVW